MASPAEKKKKFSSADHSKISSAKIGKNQQQSLGSSIETTFGEEQKKKMMEKRILKRKIWICSDVLMDILPFFDHFKLGLKLALISDRFDILVDTHFDGKSALTIWREITIGKGRVTSVFGSNSVPFLSPDSPLQLFVKGKSEGFPLPDRPLPSKIRIKCLQIKHIDHSVIAFLRANKQIWDKRGTNLRLFSTFYFTIDIQPFVEALVREILPIFAPTIQRLHFLDVDILIKCHHAWPTFLSDLTRLNSIDAHLILHSLGDDHLDAPNANASAGQALFKWLHTPRKDALPKRLVSQRNHGYFEWIDNFKKAFLRATTLAAAYTVQFPLAVTSPIVPFQLVNERTQEKLTLMYIRVEHMNYNGWQLKRCPISEKAADQWDDEILHDLNNAIVSTTTSSRRRSGSKQLKGRQSTGRPLISGKEVNYLRKVRSFESLLMM